MKHYYNFKTTKILVAVALFFSQAIVWSQTETYSFDENFNPLTLDSIPFVSGGISAGLNPENEHGIWSNQFSMPGIEGIVYTTYSDSTGLYIGGNFVSAGATIANSIVRWDGRRWSAFGEGAENGLHRDANGVPAVYAIARYKDKLFIGGSFTRAGTTEVNGIAMWDGNKWNELGTDSLDGVRKVIALENDSIINTGAVYSLYIHKDKLFVGGFFHFAGDIRSAGVAVWDLIEERWETFGQMSITGTSLVYGYSFASFGNMIVAGGMFDYAGGTPVKNIASYNGFGWCPMGQAEGIIRDMKFDKKGNLYAVGYFNADEANGNCGIGIWDGLSWTPMKGPEGYYSAVTYIKFIQDELYAAGSFENEQGEWFTLAKWNGSSWEIMEGLGQSYSDFFPGGVRGIEQVDDKLYVAGDFTKAGDVFAVNIAEWDKTNNRWLLVRDESANKGIHDGFVYALEQSGSDIYAGGDFTVAGGIYTRNIAKWNGNNWEPLGTGPENGIRGRVYAILKDGDDVFVGGYFGNAGSNTVYHIAKWNGSEWKNLGIGVGGVQGAHVNSLARWGNYLYAGGYFTMVGDEENAEKPANSIARFDLTTERWESIGSGIEYTAGDPGIVFDMEVSGEMIYIGGNFNAADGLFSPGFTVLKNNKFTGPGDDSIQSGVEGTVYSIKVINNEIVIGGHLGLERFGEQYGILKWDGEKWTAFNDKLGAESGSAYVSNIAPFKGGFIAGGYFNKVGDQEVGNFAYYDGNQWLPLGGGIRPIAYRLAIDQNKIFFSGPTIMYTGSGFSLGLAQFNFEDDVTSYNPGNSDNGNSLWNYPNPFRSNTTIHFSIENPAQVKITLFDVTGKETEVLLNEFRQPGNHTLLVNPANLQDGIYFYRLEYDSKSETGKMVFLK